MSFVQKLLLPIFSVMEVGYPAAPEHTAQELLQSHLEKQLQGKISPDSLTDRQGFVLFPPSKVKTHETPLSPLVLNSVLPVMVSGVEFLCQTFQRSWVGGLTLRCWAGLSSIFPCLF